MKTSILSVICAFVLCGILVAGLWPFHRPHNQVTWLENDNGLRFGRGGTVFSSDALEMPGLRDKGSCSIEIWLQPSLNDNSSTFLTFSTPENPLRFSLRQSGVALELRRGQPHPARTTRLYVGPLFRREKRVFITVTSGPQKTSTYADGVLISMSDEFRLAANDCTGQIVVGTSPVENDWWSGQLQGLAIYHRQLTPEQVFRHYEAWAARGRPALSENEGTVALYLFNEHGGRVVHNHASAGMDLSIPEQYRLLHQTFLKPPWEEFSISWDYLKDVLINVAGFIPLGFFFCAYFSSVPQVKRGALATIILGGTVSLTIEILQAYLPTRYSGTTDLVTNTLGTYLGVILCRITNFRLAESFPHWANAPTTPAVQGKKEKGQGTNAPPPQRKLGV